MTALALAVALSGMPELIGLYNENKLASPHLLRQRGMAPLHAAPPQVCRASDTLHTGHSLAISAAAESENMCPAWLKYSVSQIFRMPMSAFQLVIHAAKSAT